MGFVVSLILNVAAFVINNQYFPNDASSSTLVGLVAGVLSMLCIMWRGASDSD